VDPKVLYIAGYGRSGSTFLDMLLGNHSDVFGAGEITHLFSSLLEDKVCTCGEIYAKCPVWGAVAERVRAKLPTTSFISASQLTRRTDGWQPGGPSPEYTALWRAVFESVSEVTNRTWTVDSSKTGWDATGRVPALRAAFGDDLKVVHLVRDPRAVVFARLKRASRLVDAPWSARWGPDSSAGRAMRAVVGWSAAHMRVRDADLLMRYEDLTSGPIAELDRLGDLMAVDASQWIELVRTEASLHPGHAIKGNRGRRGGPVRLVPDEEWKTALPGYGRAIATLATPLARRYGYGPPVSRGERRR
jgi:sulfotransferase family protein